MKTKCEGELRNAVNEFNKILKIHDMKISTISPKSVGFFGKCRKSLKIEMKRIVVEKDYNCNYLGNFNIC